MKKLFLILFLTGFCFADEQVFVQVRFQEKTDIGEYSDALYFSQSEYDKLSKSDIDKMKADRVNNWKTAIQTASQAEPVEQTSEELEQQKLAIEEQIASLTTQVAEVATKIETVKALEAIKLEESVIIDKKVVKE